jgi:hypothetical protein
MLFLSEARTTEEMNNNLIHIEGYRIFRWNSFSRHTGGLVVYIKTCIECIETLNYCKTNSWYLSIRVTKGFFKGNYGVTYKSPKEKSETFLKLFDERCEKSVDCESFNLIMGDFNIDVTKQTSTVKKLLDYGNQYELSQIIRDSTREAGSSPTYVGR